MEVLTKEDLKALKKLKSYLSNGVKVCQSENNMNTASWGYEEGILLTGNDAKLILKALSKK